MRHEPTLLLTLSAARLISYSHVMSSEVIEITDECPSLDKDDLYNY